MICQVCGKREATIMVLRTSNHMKETLYVCPVCAGKANSGIMGDMTDLLSPILENILGGAHSSPICPTCGQTQRQFESTGKLQCKDWYAFFNSSGTHVGKKPKKNQEALDHLNRIKEKELELKRLIEDEKYEEAARLRDELKSLREEAPYDS